MSSFAKRALLLPAMTFQFTRIEIRCFAFQRSACRFLSSQLSPMHFSLRRQAMSAITTGYNSRFLQPLRERFMLFQKRFEFKIHNKGGKFGFETSTSKPSGKGGQQGSNNNSNNNNNNNKGDKDKLRLFGYAMVIAGVSFMVGVAVGSDNNNGTETSEGRSGGGGGNRGGQPYLNMYWQEFEAHVLVRHAVQRIVVDREESAITAYLHPGHKLNGFNVIRVKVASVEAFQNKLKNAGTHSGTDFFQEIDVLYKKADNGASDFIWSLIGLGFVLAAYFYFNKRNIAQKMEAMKSKTPQQGPFTKSPNSNSTPERKSSPFGRDPFSMGKIKAYRVTPEMATTSFKDVAGLGEAKVELKEFVSFLKNPETFQTLGAKVPKGAMLIGPPGTGKTLLAKAIAGESGVPFLAVSGSDFVEMFVGVGPSRVRDLFKQAREIAPCIVYIDEIDAIAKARGTGGKFGGGTNSERESTLNQLLVELDGFNTVEGCLVLASTNRVDILDKALLRPGRFDRQISCDLPTLIEREEIFRIHTKRLRVRKKVLAEVIPRMAALSQGLSGAQIASICNEAALIAARNAKDEIFSVDFDAAVDRVTSGMERKSRIISQHEKEIVALHEAGHALVAWKLEHADPVLKVTIIPRGSGSLGQTRFSPSSAHLHSEDQIHHKMTTLMGGKAAEEIVFGKVTTGARDDLLRATDLATDQVTRFGMGHEVGLLVHDLPRSSDDGKKKISNKKAGEIDQFVKRQVETAYAAAKDLLMQNKQQLLDLQRVLLEKEVVSFDDVKTMFGPPANNFDPHVMLLDEAEKYKKAMEEE
eukprot:m.43724 g.43724  ORF g.43724 m.43724 type:complete len:809 (-) comp7127_c0_seq1:865-3291(-)